MQILSFAAVILIAWWFNLSAGIIAIVAVSLALLLFWWNRRGTRKYSHHQHSAQDTSNYNSSHTDSFATAVMASSFQHDASLNNRSGDSPNSSSDSYSSDNSSCSYDSSSSDSGSSSSSND